MSAIGDPGKTFALAEWQIRQVLPHRPPVLQLDAASRCAPAAGELDAVRHLSGSDAMLLREGGPARLAPSALLEALAQCCGLLLRLRWLAERGADLAAFAAGQSHALDGHVIPRSVLAESRARFPLPAPPGTAIGFATRLLLSRGGMHRFEASALAHGAEHPAAVAEIVLNFPFAEPGARA